MPSNVEGVDDFQFYSDDEVLFDANVWIFLEGPPGSPGEVVEKYSRLLERLTSMGCSLVISPAVLAEFINRYCRLHYNVWVERRNKSFKEFRGSAAFAEVHEGVSQASNTILSLCHRSVRTVTTHENLSEDIATLSNISCDFVDLQIVRQCLTEQLILVTHDSDFARHDGLSIVTANGRMLQA